MAKVKVQSPSKTYSGVTAGVRFSDGVGEFDPKRQIAAARYFDRHGYTYKGAEPVEVESAGEQEAVIGNPGDGGSAASVEGLAERDAALGGDPGEGVPVTDGAPAAEAEAAPAAPKRAAKK